MVAGLLGSSSSRPATTWTLAENHGAMAAMAAARLPGSSCGNTAMMSGVEEAVRRVEMPCNWMTLLRLICREATAFFRAELKGRDEKVSR